LENRATSATALSISNLIGNKWATNGQHAGNIPETHSVCAHLDAVPGRDGAARRSSPVKNSVELRTEMCASCGDAIFNSNLQPD
jgi:hypothetical protein